MAASSILQLRQQLLVARRRKRFLQQEVARLIDERNKLEFDKKSLASECRILTVTSNLQTTLVQDMKAYIVLLEKLVPADKLPDKSALPSRL